MAATRLTSIRGFSGKVVVVCGGSKGIGKATAREVVRRGGSVCLVARDPASLAETAVMLTSLSTNGAFVETISCDTTDQRRLEPLLEDFVARRGVPDYLLNMVGCAYPGYVDELGLSDYRAAMETNYFGQLVPLLILLPHFRRAGRGHIANVSSILGYMGVMGYASYAPTKYAVVGLTEVLRHELGPQGLRFSILFPPDTDTPGFAKENETKPQEWFAINTSKLMSAEDVAAAFVKGLVKGRFYIMPGQVGLVWRVARFAPRLLHWFSDRELAVARRRLGKT